MCVLYMYTQIRANDCLLHVSLQSQREMQKKPYETSIIALINTRNNEHHIYPRDFTHNTG